MPKGKGEIINWNGVEISLDLERAIKQAMDETMAEAVTDAKEHVPVRTGVLQGSIRLTPATSVGNHIEGEWGSYGVNYALAVELGNPHLAVPSDGSTRETTPYQGPGKNTGYNGFLRGAADKEYPKLAGRIAERFKQ